MPSDLPYQNRATRLKVLLDEEKTLDEPMLVVAVNALLDTMSRHQERFQTKNAVLGQFRITLKACRKAGPADKERICTWLEKILEIQNLESSDGMLDSWMNGIPF